MDGVICYIGIGSNLGDPLHNCKHAVGEISRVDGILLTSASSFYSTEPVGNESQNYFVNAVVEIKTILSAQQILRALHEIEIAMGRKIEAKGAPRIIDLDILFYGQDIINEDNLTVPHPQMYMRRFVLEPLAEIASYLIHPAFSVSVRGLKERLNDSKIVEMIKE